MNPVISLSLIILRCSSRRFLQSFTSYPSFLLQLSSTEFPRLMKPEQMIRVAFFTLRCLIDYHVLRSFLELPRLWFSLNSDARVEV